MSKEATALQDRIIDGVVTSLDEGRDAFIEGPTGCGKSRKYTRIAEKEAGKGQSTLVLTHRRKLVRQGVKNMERWADGHVNVSIGMDGAIDQSGDVVFSTVQSAVANIDELRPYDRLIIDEAHHATRENAEYMAVIDRLMKLNPDMLMVGASATPPEEYKGMHPRLEAADKHILTFEEAVAARLVDLPEVVLANVQLKDHKTIEGIVADHRRDDKSSALETGIGSALTRALPDDWVDQQVYNYERHLGDRRVLGFFDSKKEAEAFMTEASERGHVVDIIHSGRSDKANNKAMDDFQAGKLPLLVSVDMISEGVDLDADGILLCKRSTSSTEYRQINGRGARSHGEERSRKTKLVDMGASTHMHGDIAAQASMQNLRGGIDRKTIEDDALLPERTGKGFAPWIAMEGGDKVYATSVDGAVVYAVPTENGYAAFRSTKDRKGEKLELLEIEGQKKGLPSRDAFGKWVSDAIRRNEHALSRMIASNRNSLADIVERDWTKHGASVKRNAQMLSTFHPAIQTRAQSRMCGIGV